MVFMIQLERICSRVFFILLYLSSSPNPHLTSLYPAHIKPLHLTPPTSPYLTLPHPHYPHLTPPNSPYIPPPCPHQHIPPYPTHLTLPPYLTSPPSNPTTPRSTPSMILRNRSTLFNVYHSSYNQIQKSVQRTLYLLFFVVTSATSFLFSTNNETPEVFSPWPPVSRMNRGSV